MLGLSNYSLPLLKFVTDYTIFVFDIDFSILESNLKDDLVLGQNVMSILKDNYGLVLQLEDKDIFNMTSDFISIQLENISKNVLLLNISNKLNTDAKVGAIMIENDINIERQNRDLIQMTKKLHEINNNLEDFVHIISHDLQAPLRKIKSFGKLLGDNIANDLNEENSYYLQRMNASAETMENLINDLLLYSRQTKISLEKEEIFISEIIQTALETLDMQDENVVEFKNSCTSTKIIGVKSQIIQLIENLFSNAYKYKKKNSKLVLEVDCATVKGEMVSDESAIPTSYYTIISIKDNGVGFDQNDNVKIFNIFTRLKNTSSDIKGSGIGLAIVKKIIMNHGGFISAHGEKNVGATFNLYIPQS